MTTNNNYLKLEGGSFHRESIFYFDDRSKASAQEALTLAQLERGRADRRISVYRAERHGRIPGVREIGRSTGASLQSVGAPVGVSQSNLIGLPRREKVA